MRFRSFRESEGMLFIPISISLFNNLYLRIKASLKWKTTLKLNGEL